MTLQKYARILNSAIFLFGDDLSSKIKTNISKEIKLFNQVLSDQNLSQHRH